MLLVRCAKTPSLKASARPVSIHKTGKRAGADERTEGKRGSLRPVDMERRLEFRFFHPGLSQPMGG